MLIRSNCFVCSFLKNTKKGGLPVIDFHWKIFSKTGSIETYLLMKEIETMYNSLMPPEQDNIIELPNYNRLQSKM
ncbi:hypothetical protein CHH53_07145 [Terribacillus sp. 7520-G]|nr:hypothetical protein CHH53_07145 [Terribacillus sp. 7520-G]